MADEIGGVGIEDINSGGEVRENTNKVTEEAVRRIQDNQKKAQQIAQDIKKDKATNDKIAKFLAFLLRDIKSDTVIRQIYHTFFKTRNEETDLVHLRKSANSVVVVGMFVPFYQNIIEELGLQTIYQDIFDFDGEIYLTKYIGYIKQLLPKYHDNIMIDRQEFIKLLGLIAEYYELTEKLSGEKATEFQNTLKNELTLPENE